MCVVSGVYKLQRFVVNLSQHLEGQTGFKESNEQFTTAFPTLNTDPSQLKEFKGGI